MPIEKPYHNEGELFLMMQSNPHKVAAYIAALESVNAQLIAIAHDKAEEVAFAGQNPKTFGVGTFEEIAFALANIEDVIEIPKIESSNPKSESTSVESAVLSSRNTHQGYVKSIGHIRPESDNTRVFTLQLKDGRELNAVISEKRYAQYGQELEYSLENKYSLFCDFDFADTQYIFPTFIGTIPF